MYSLLLYQTAYCYFHLSIEYEFQTQMFGTDPYAP